MYPYVYRLVGDVLVSTAFLSYGGPFNQDFRALLFKNWFKELKTRKIPFTLNLNTIDMLVDPNTVCIQALVYNLTLAFHISKFHQPKETFRKEKV